MGHIQSAAGWPCQDLSVAGLRKGLAGERSGLFWEVIRFAERLRPRWLLLENVPGLLSANNGRDFGIVLSALDDLGYGLAWRVLDAQFFGVPQRRRRVFIVGHLGAPCPAEILFECESLSGDSQESGEAGTRVTALSADGVGTCGADDNQAQGGHVIAPLTTKPYADNDAQESRIVTHSLTGEGHDAGEDGTGRGTPIVTFPLASDPIHSVGIAQPVTGRNGDPGCVASVVYALGSHSGAADGEATNKSHAAGGPVGMGIAQNIVPILEVDGGTTRGEGPNGTGIGDAGDPMYTLQEGKQHALAFTERTRKDGRNLETSEKAYALCNPGSGGRTHSRQLLDTTATPRRLTPTECERLQGFPDGWTDIPGASDSARYRALGNSMAVPCVGWILERLVRCDRALREAA